MSKIIVANWKMNGTRQFTMEYSRKFLDNLTRLNLKQTIVLCPPFPYLAIMQEYLTSVSQIKLGGQNVSPYKNGAYTGEISAEMLSDIGCEFCIVGHSERRQLFHEDNQTVALKFQALIHYGITPILCVGETLTELQQGKTFDILEEQLKAVLTMVESKNAKFMIAYEPVWAIGTGKVPTIQEIDSVHSFIRTKLKQFLVKDSASLIKILYGGSVKAHNISSILNTNEVDGALVGGASLDITEFMDMCRCNN